MSVVTIQRISSAFIFNLARIDPKELGFKTQGTGQSLFTKGAVAGELADVVVFGFVIASELIDGRTYIAGGNQTRLLKDLRVLPIQQEWERSQALLGMVYGNKVAHVNVTDDGAITFSTKHTTVDEEGNAEKKSKKFLSQGSHSI